MNAGAQLEPHAYCVPQKQNWASVPRYASRRQSGAVEKSFDCPRNLVDNISWSRISDTNELLRSLREPFCVFASIHLVKHRLRLLIQSFGFGGTEVWAGTRRCSDYSSSGLLRYVLATSCASSPFSIHFYSSGPRRILSPLSAWVVVYAGNEYNYIKCSDFTPPGQARQSFAFTLELAMYLLLSLCFEV